MAKRAAKQNDRIVARDRHFVNVDGSYRLLPHRFDGRLVKNLSRDVRINGQRAATVGSVAINRPPHTPTSPGTSFQTRPSNRGSVRTGSSTVFINGRPAARQGDFTETCADPAPNQNGRVQVEVGNVFIG